MIIATAIRIILLKMYGCGHQVRASLRSTIVPIEMCGDASLFAVTAVEPQDVREAETRTSVSRYTILAMFHSKMSWLPTESCPAPIHHTEILQRHSMIPVADFLPLRIILEGTNGLALCRSIHPTPHFILKLTPFLRENLHGRSATRSRYDQMGPVSISASLITVLHRISLRGLQS